jgi:hypothetical protein
MGSDGLTYLPTAHETANLLLRKSAVRAVGLKRRKLVPAGFEQLPGADEHGLIDLVRPTEMVNVGHRIQRIRLTGVVLEDQSGKNG